jgi:hypothetical protein
MDIPMTLTYMRPGEEWELNGDDYAGLTWLSETDKPTEADVTAAWPDALAAFEARQAAAAQARADAIAHAKSLGFTDEMIAVMYPNLVEA